MLPNKIYIYFIFPSGRKDSSGLRFSYTSYLREYDAGILNVGEASLPFMVIPPKQESWLIESYCPKECTQVRFLTFSSVKFKTCKHAAVFFGCKATVRFDMPKMLPRLIFVVIRTETTYFIVMYVNALKMQHRRKG